MRKVIQRGGAHTLRLAISGVTAGGLFTLTLCGCASGSTGATGEAAATAQPTETATVTVTATPTSPGKCEAKDLSITIVKEKYVPWSLKFTNVSDAPCIISAGYPEVVPAVSSGDDAIPPFEESNEWDQALSDIELAPQDSAWAIFSYLDDDVTHTDETDVTSVDVFLPGSDTPISVPLDGTFYYSQGDDTASGYIRPLTPERETRSMS